MNGLLIINGWYVGIVYSVDQLEFFLEENYCVCLN